VSGVIDRPDVDFDAVEHVYAIGGERVAGVSSVAKIGGADDAFGIASAWGWRLGYEGARVALKGNGTLLDAPVPENYKEDPLRLAIAALGITPWATRDKAADRGSSVHDALEELAQNDVVPVPDKFPTTERGHVRSVLRWYLHFRPRFVATEVQVASRTHLFAGRYDLRILIRARLLLPLIVGHESPQAERIRELAARDEWALCLGDLKTSKSIYPTTHFPQLSGYEGAGVEMGFPATDCQLVINTNEDGSFDPARDVAVSWSSYDDFLGLLAAFRVIKRLKAEDPEEKARVAREEVILANLPASSRQLVDLDLPELGGLSSRDVGGLLGKLRKRGKVEQIARGVWQLPSPETDREGKRA
jgi:hypothetical protein